MFSGVIGQPGELVVSCSVVAKDVASGQTGAGVVVVVVIIVEGVPLSIFGQCVGWGLVVTLLPPDGLCLPPKVLLGRVLKTSKFSSVSQNRRNKSCRGSGNTFRPCQKWSNKTIYRISEKFSFYFLLSSS